LHSIALQHFTSKVRYNQITEFEDAKYILDIRNKIAYLILILELHVKKRNTIVLFTPLWTVRVITCSRGKTEAFCDRARAIVEKLTSMFLTDMYVVSI